MRANGHTAGAFGEPSAASARPEVRSAPATSSAPGLARRLNSEDNFFLLFETEEAPLNIGSVGIFDTIAFQDFFEMARSKMHLIPRYRQRVVPEPHGGLMEV